MRKAPILLSAWTLFQAWSFFPRLLTTYHQTEISKKMVRDLAMLESQLLFELCIHCSFLSPILSLPLPDRHSLGSQKVAFQKCVWPFPRCPTCQPWNRHGTKFCAERELKHSLLPRTLLSSSIFGRASFRSVYRSPAYLRSRWSNF